MSASDAAAAASSLDESKRLRECPKRCFKETTFGWSIPTTPKWNPSTTAEFMPLLAQGSAQCVCAICTDKFDKIKTLNKADRSTHMKNHRAELGGPYEFVSIQELLGKTITLDKCKPLSVEPKTPHQAAHDKLQAQRVLLGQARTDPQVEYHLASTRLMLSLGAPLDMQQNPHFRDMVEAVRKMPSSKSAVIGKDLTRQLIDVIHTEEVDL